MTRATSCGVPGKRRLQIAWSGGVARRIQRPVYDAVEFHEQFVLYLRQHVVDIVVVQIEGPSVDVRQIRQFFDGDVLYVLGLHQLHQSLQQQGFRPSDPSVCFSLCHIVSSYLSVNGF